MFPAINLPNLSPNLDFPHKALQKFLNLAEEPRKRRKYIHPKALWVRTNLSSTDNLDSNLFRLQIQSFPYIHSASTTDRVSTEADNLSPLEVEIGKEFTRPLRHMVKSLLKFTRLVTTAIHGE